MVNVTVLKSVAVHVLSSGCGLSLGNELLLVGFRETSPKVWHGMLLVFLGRVAKVLQTSCMLLVGIILLRQSIFSAALVLLQGLIMSWRQIWMAAIRLNAESVKGKQLVETAVVVYVLERWLL